MPDDIVKALESVDKFYKNCFLLFEDIVKEIRTKKGTFSEPCRLPENFAITSPNNSEYRKTYIRKDDSHTRFISMLIKTPDWLMKKDRHDWDEICGDELKIDPSFPLIILYGILIPRNIERFESTIIKSKDFSWINNIILLDLKEEIKPNRNKPYEFDKLLKFETPDETDSWFCEQALFKIKRLVDIKDSKAVSRLVKDFWAVS